MNSRVSRLLGLLLVGLTGVTGALAQGPKAQWIPIEPRAEPGTPVRLEVLKSSREATTVRLQVPGYWLETETYAGRSFSRITFPEPRLEGLGLPAKEGERGWYDFPADTQHPLLPAAPFHDSLSIGTPKPLFPENAVDQKPQTAAEMERLGIDPAGARPGIPSIRGYLAVSRANGRGDLQATSQEIQYADLKLEAPLRPAGFEGSDQVKPDDSATVNPGTTPTVRPDEQNTGYLPPQLVDEEFYKSFKGEYRGTEEPLSAISGAGVFSTAEFRIPLVEVLTPLTARVISIVVFEIKHLKGTEDFDCPLSWDNWIFKIPFINGPAIREALTAKGLKIEASRSAHYLIVTPREYRDELNTFALWKQSKGLNVDFAYIGNAATDDVAPDRNALDAYLEEFFKKNYCHGVYVLLVGDTDVIPTGRSTRVIASPDANDG
ncbi:MAG: C25 family cysteine peptidase, partial [Limisphaerales bacterium]